MQIVEFKIQDKMSCISPVGRAIGMEPITEFSCNYPAPDTYPSRLGIEGFTLIESLPHIPTVNIDTVPPVPLVPKSAEVFASMLKEVSETYGESSKNPVLLWWRRWFVDFAPESDDSKEYVKKLKKNGFQYRIPLSEYIFDKKNFNKELVWDNEMLDDPFNVINPNFKWPTILAAAMPSVVTRFDKHPPEPRLYLIGDEYLSSLSKRYSEVTDRYYTSSTMTVIRAKDILVNKVIYYS